MPKLIRLLLLLVGAIFGIAHPTPAFGNERPNIVLIMADDMGFECVSSNGEAFYKTPNIDKLAKRGVRFTNAHATPICTPTRVQIMSGL